MNNIGSPFYHARASYTPDTNKQADLTNTSASPPITPSGVNEPVSRSFAGVVGSSVLITGGLIALGLYSVYFVATEIFGTGGVSDKVAKASKKKILKAEKGIKEIRENSPITKEEAQQIGEKAGEAAALAL